MSPHLNRRAALKVLAALPAILKAAPERTMFLALNSVLISGRVPWPDFARLAAKVGFPGTDVMLGRAMQEGAQATNELLEGLHVLPAALDLPVEFRKDDAAFEASLSKLEPGGAIRGGNSLSTHDHVHHAVERHAERSAARDVQEPLYTGCVVSWRNTTCGWDWSFSALWSYAGSSSMSSSGA